MGLPAEWPEPLGIGLDKFKSYRSTLQWPNRVSALRRKTEYQSNASEKHRVGDVDSETYRKRERAVQRHEIDDGR